MITNEIILTKEPIIKENCSLKNVTFETYNEVGINNFIENTHFGAYSYTGQFCFIQNAKIGKFSNIAACVRIGPTDHPMERASQHHFTYRGKMYGFDDKDDEEFFSHRYSRITTIGHDTWIGHGAIILPDLKVGNGAIIGSGAVVTKDVPPYAIVVGVPAKIVRYRFDEEIINKLEEIKWWDWNEEEFKNAYFDFRLPINEFVKKHYKGKQNE